MTKEEFEKSYIEKSAISTEFYHQCFVTLPCDCGDKFCKGWAAIHNSPDMIASHNKLYAPKQRG